MKELVHIQQQLQEVYETKDVERLATCLDALLELLQRRFKNEEIHGDMEGL